MDQAEQVRRYIDEQIVALRSDLRIWMEQRVEAHEKITELAKTLELLGGMREYMEQAGAEKGTKLPLFEEGLEEEQPYAEMSIADAAFEVLKDAGRPLHVSKIWEELLRGGKTLEAKKPTFSVTGALLRDVRFENLGMNTFTLKEVPTDPDGDGYAKS